MFNMVNIKLKGKEQRSKRSRNLNKLDEILESFKYNTILEEDKHGI